MNLSQKQSVKVIGQNGQISLGKKFAGRQVLVEEHEPGVWTVRTAQVIPDNEMWLHGTEARRDLEDAMAVASKTAPSESDLHAFSGMIENATNNKDKA